MPMSREEVFQMFQGAARVVWSNADSFLHRLSIDAAEPSGGVLASLTYTGNPWALSSVIVRPAETYVLRVSERALALDPEVLRRVMIHEAVHIGVRHHGRDFLAACRKHGGTISGAEAEGEKTAELVLEIQDAPRKRYRPFKTFPPDGEAAARAFVREYKKTNPGVSFRICY